eukprot:COSAG02_NODE_489_length_21246_cov_49.035702_6_plen_77_part_00
MRPLCVATAPSYLSPLLVASLLESAGDDTNAIKHAWAQLFIGLGGVAMLVAAIYATFVVVDVVDEAKKDAKTKKAD